MLVPIEVDFRWSKINRGAEVTLIGFKTEPITKPMAIVWSKDDGEIKEGNSDKNKYSFLRKKRIMLINDFQEQDSGTYKFQYITNRTKYQVYFNLQMKTKGMYIEYTKRRVKLQLNC